MTKRKRKRPIPPAQASLDALSPEAREVFESARRNQQGSPPRKHHLVPAFYLNNWADNGQIRVTHVDEDRRSYTTAPKNAARETDYYSLAADGVDADEVPPVLGEMALSQAEGWGAEAIAHLIEHGAQDCPPKLAAQLAWFLGHQVTRGETFRREQRSIAHDLFVIKNQGMTDEGIRKMLVAQGEMGTAEQVASARQGLEQIVSGDARIRPQDAAIVAMGFEIAKDIGQTFLQRSWLVYRTGPVLLTCDEPVVSIGGPGADRGERAGLGTAAVVVFPLAPTALLAMFRNDVHPTGPASLTTAEALDVNREVLANATRWAFERATRKTSTRLAIPAAAQGSTMEGPMPYESKGGTEGIVYRNFKPSRWAAEPSTPWPVPRWYT